MRKMIGLMLISVSTAFLTGSVHAGPAAPLTSIPPEAKTVTDWYKQDVYDQNNSKLGEVKDVLIDKSGKASTLILGVGGFLGADEKNVAIPFDAVEIRNGGNDSWRLVINATADGLKAGPTYTYDRQSTTWVPATR